MLEFMKIGFKQVAFGGDSGGGGGGGGSDKDKTPAPQTSNVGTFEGPMPGGSAGYTQDLNKISVDRNTGFVTENRNRDRDRDPRPDTVNRTDVAAPVSPPSSIFFDGETLLPPDETFADRAAVQANLDAARDSARDRADRDDRTPTPVFEAPRQAAPVFQGPTFDGPGYSQDLSIGVDRDTGFLTDSSGGGGGSAPAPEVVQPPLFQGPTFFDGSAGYSQDPTIGVDRNTGFLTDSNRFVSRGIETLVPSTPQRPDISNRSDLLAAATPPGQTGRSDTFQQLYGYDPLDVTAERARELSGPELADLLLARDDTDLTGQLMRTNPEFFLPSNNQQTVMASGQVPAETPGARTTPRDVFMQDEVQTLIEASPEARQVYETLDLVPFVENINLGASFGGGPTDFGQVTRYRDPQGNEYTAAEAFNYIQSGGAQSMTLPGGYEVIAPFDQTAAPPTGTLDPGFRPVDLATPISLVGSGGGGGGGGGGSAGGGAGRGDPRDFGFVAEEAAASRGSRPGIEGLLDRSPTLGQPAATSVPQASDLISQEADSAPGGTRESPPRLVAPSPDSTPDVDVTVTRPDVVGGDTEATEDVEVTVDTGDGFSTGQEEDTGTTTDEDAGVRGGTDGDEGAGEGVEVDIGAGGDEGAGTGGEGTGAGTGTGTGDGAGEGTGTGTGEGAGDGSGTGSGSGAGTGAGSGGGDGTGEGAEEDVEVTVDGDTSDEDEDEEEEELLLEEEPPFECPDGFRTVQLANGGFTCVPEMVRPRVGPYTQTIDVSALEGRTPYRPGARRT